MYGCFQHTNEHIFIGRLAAGWGLCLGYQACFTLHRIYQRDPRGQAANFRYEYRTEIERHKLMFLITTAPSP
jgi:hypothetical protein